MQPRIVPLPYQTPRAGGYAAPTTTKSWLHTPVSAGPAKAKKMKVSTINHPLFAQCADLCTDPYWKGVFTQASIGKMPRGFSFAHNTLTYKNRQKTQTLVLGPPDAEEGGGGGGGDPSIDAATALLQCKEFFRAHGGLQSDLDIERVRQERELQLAETTSFQEMTWEELRKNKSLLDSVISVFVDARVQQMDLTAEERDDLKAKINMGFLLGCFTEDRVQYQNGRLLDLVGLTWNAATRRFGINPDVIPKERHRTRRAEPAKSKDTVSLMEQWNKHISNQDRSTPLSPGSTPSTGTSQASTPTPD